MAVKLNQDQLTTLLNAITHRATFFPRAQLRNKLEAADKMYHLAKNKTTTDNSNSSTRPSDGVDNRDRDGDQDDEPCKQHSEGLPPFDIPGHDTSLLDTVRSERSPTEYHQQCTLGDEVKQALSDGLLNPLPASWPGVRSFGQ